MNILCTMYTLQYTKKCSINNHICYIRYTCFDVTQCMYNIYMHNKHIHSIYTKQAIDDIIKNTYIRVHIYTCAPINQTCLTFP